jgi:hypothetical protein
MEAAASALMAQALSGDTEAAWASFEGFSPAHRSRHATRGPATPRVPAHWPGFEMTLQLEDARSRCNTGRRTHGA